MRGASLHNFIIGLGVALSCSAQAAFAASRQPLVVSARVLTACGLTTKADGSGNVRARCTGEVTLQAPAGVSLSREHGANATIFHGRVARSKSGETRVVTLLF